MSYVAHQYSRVDFYSSLEVNLSLYYGGVIFMDENPEKYPGIVRPRIYGGIPGMVHNA